MPLGYVLTCKQHRQKDAEVWAWFQSNRHWLEVHQLPPYSPELNPTERLWQHTRKNGTHNRFFGGLDALPATLPEIKNTYEMTVS